MPSAHAILYMLSGFLGLWGLSLVYRGTFGERSRTRGCPSCNTPLPKGVRRCDNCGYESDKNRHFWTRKRSLPMAGSGVLSVAAGAFSFWFGIIVQNMGMDDIDFSNEFSPVQYLSFGMLGFAAMFTAWAIAGERAKGKARCPKCWYDLSATDTMRCSECGFEATKRRQLYKPRRRWKALIVSAGVLLLATAGLYEQRYRQGGWVAVVPTTALILGFHHWPDDAILYGAPGVDEDWSLSRRWGDDWLWAWQERWLDTTCAASMNAPGGLGDIERASRFHAAEDLGPVFELVAAQIASDDKAVRVEAASVFLNSFYGIMSWRDDNADRIAREIATNRAGLIAALDDPDPRVVMVAVQLLVIIDDDPMPYLPVALAAAKNGSLGRHTVYAVARHIAEHTPGGVASLLDFIEQSDDPGVVFVVRALKYAVEPDDALIDRLLGMLESDRPGTAKAAVQLLNRWAYRDRHEVFGTMLDRAERESIDTADFLPLLWNQRFEEFSPGELVGLHAETERLAPLLEHDDPGVVRTAIESLEYLTWGGFVPGPQWIERLETCWESNEDLNVRNAADDLLVIIDPGSDRWSRGDPYAVSDDESADDSNADDDR